MSDKATGEWTELLNHEWVSVERRGGKAATHTARPGFGEKHLQRTVNMGNEQSGLFPLGLYSRGNEKKTREMTSHWEIKCAWGSSATRQKQTAGMNAGIGRMNRIWLKSWLLSWCPVLRQSSQADLLSWSLMYIQWGSETAADIDCWRVFCNITSISIAWQLLSANDRRLADRDVWISQLNF